MVKWSIWPGHSHFISEIIAEVNFMSIYKLIQLNLFAKYPDQPDEQHLEDGQFVRSSPWHTNPTGRKVNKTYLWIQNPSIIQHSISKFMQSNSLTNNPSAEWSVTIRSIGHLMVVLMCLFIQNPRIRQRSILHPLYAIKPICKQIWSTGWSVYRGSVSYGQPLDYQNLLVSITCPYPSKIQGIKRLQLHFNL